MDNRVVGCESGGYDYEFVDPPPDTLICGICRFPSKKPQLSVCCGHTFCEHCIDGAKIADGAFKCPVCREAFSCFANKQADRIIKDLKVFCMYKTKGCNWLGEVRSISDHLEKNCRFREMDCPKGCGISVQREKVFWHVENECVCRIVSCVHCHITGEQRFILGDHRNHCPNLLVPCPNRCFSSRMPKGSINGHLKMCPLEKICCSNECGTSLLQKDLENHVKNCPHQMICCQYCQHEGEQDAVNGQHKEQCLKFPVKCPNGCEAGIMMREDVEAHKRICPLEEVSCEYFRVGCEAKMARKDLAQHNKEKMEDHLSLALHELDKLEKLQTSQAAAADKALQKINDRISIMEAAHHEQVTELRMELQSLLGICNNNWLAKISQEATKVSSGTEVMPVTIRISGFRNKRDEGPWTSDPFYSHTDGHKLKLIMHGTGSGDWFTNRFNSFSLSLYVIYTAHEKRFKRGTVKISLLNQRNDNAHHTSLMNVQVPDLEEDMQIGKIDRFINYDNLYRATTNCRFLESSSIFIKLQWVQLDQISLV